MNAQTEKLMNELAETPEKYTVDQRKVLLLKLIASAEGNRAVEIKLFKPTGEYVLMYGPLPHGLVRIKKAGGSDYMSVYPDQLCDLDG